MSNQVYDRVMYNEETKRRFLDKYPKASQKTYSRIFFVTEQTEKVKNKDLYEFNIDEIKSVLYTLSPLSLAASKSNASIVNNYIDWAIKEGKRSNNINPVRGIIDIEWLKQFINKAILPFISEQKLISLESECQNAQDKVIFRLLFEGVQGRKDCAEIINLKKHDIDFENKILTLIDYDESTRKQKVSQRCIEMIDEAISEDIYYKKNGEMKPTKNVREYTDLVQNDYVIRSSITKTDNYKAVDKHVIYRRIDIIREVRGYPRLTVKNMAISGMIKMAKDLLERDGELDKSQYQEICDKFNVKSHWSILKASVNIENIKKLYREG